MKLTTLKKKLILGTVQLGLHYGINNNTGKPDRKEAFRILRKAESENIFLLDSADAYGDSLQVISAYLHQQANTSFEIISKFIGDDISIKKKVGETLEALNTGRLYGYMYHRFSDYRSEKYRKELQDLKHDGKIEKIGVSIYSMAELEESIADPDLSIIQIPLNPLDASPKKMELLGEARQLGKEIHVRSIFLQGLFFKPIDQLTGNMKEFINPLRQFKNIATSCNLSIRQLCMNFALHQPNVDFVIVGVENSEQLDQNIQAIIPEISAGFFEHFESIPLVSEFLLNPSNWKP